MTEPLFKAWVMKAGLITLGSIPQSEVRGIKITRGQATYPIQYSYDQATAEKLVKIGAYQNPSYDYEIVEMPK